MRNGLPDTPWHVGFAKKEEDDPRRHKSRCIHINKGICQNSRSRHYNGNCGGSSHCEEYSESYAEYEKKREERKTIEEIEQDNIDAYKKRLENKKKRLIESDSLWQHRSTEELRRCLVCDEFIDKGDKPVKKCNYCGMYYVNVDAAEDIRVKRKIEKKMVFYMKQK